MSNIPILNLKSLIIKAKEKRQIPYILYFVLISGEQRITAFYSGFNSSESVKSTSNSVSDIDGTENLNVEASRLKDSLNFIV